MTCDALDRSPMIGRCVFEHQGLDDSAVARRLARARALLAPSFVETFPAAMAEALLQGVPVVASDLPAMRAVGGAAPDYLDPLDLPAWLEAILAYAEPDSPPRAAQLARIADWSPPRWEDHFAAVAAFLESLPPASAQRLA